MNTIDGAPRAQNVKLTSTPNKTVPPPPPPHGRTPVPAGPPDLIDSTHPAADALLAGIQGNILKGHGRDHVKLVFLRFTDAAGAATELGGFCAADGPIQTAREQLDYVRLFRQYGIPGPTFANVFLTAAGYKALGRSLKAFDEPISEALGPIPAVDTRFVNGAKDETTLRELSDPAPSSWDEPFRQEIHALILLADDNRTQLDGALHAVLLRFSACANVLTVESGDVIRNARGEAIEHFGYVDGRSQPLFLAEDVVREIEEFDAEMPEPGPPPGRYGLRFDPRAGRDLVLVPDPFLPEGADPAAGLGSFFVFRKLEQNVRGFKQQEQLLADALGLAGDARERAGAHLVGRFEDGTPVTLRGEDGLHQPVPNNFDYAYDPDGARCPFAAHLRKMNPRGDTARIFGGMPGLPPAEALLEIERSHRIARRGITYGERREPEPGAAEDLGRLPSGGVGLLFMCFQANISRQFGFIQKNWANTDAFVKPGTGIDGVIGQGANPGMSGNPIQQRFPLEYGEPGTVRFGFQGFVTMKGGEFFFAPSIAFLRALGAAPPPLDSGQGTGAGGQTPGTHKPVTGLNPAGPDDASGTA